MPIIEANSVVKPQQEYIVASVYVRDEELYI